MIGDRSVAKQPREQSKSVIGQRRASLPLCSQSSATAIPDFTKISANATTSRSSAEKRCSVGTFSNVGNTTSHGGAISRLVARNLLAAGGVSRRAKDSNGKGAFLTTLVAIFTYKGANTAKAFYLLPIDSKQIAKLPQRDTLQCYLSSLSHDLPGYVIQSIFVLIFQNGPVTNL